MKQTENRTLGPWLSISANGGGPTIKVGTKWIRATPNDIAAMKATPDLLEALMPFAKAHATWSGGDAVQHFSQSVSPADFLKAVEALAKAGAA